jgi:predicted ATPase/DNA-binding CsgD family transcriptional regulator
VSPSQGDVERATFEVETRRERLKMTYEEGAPVGAVRLPTVIDAVRGAAASDRTSARSRPVLPAAAEALIGRAREISAARALLDAAGVRLVTLSGPGGVGKTTLAITVARSLPARGRRVVFVDLVEARQAADLPRAIVARLGADGVGRESAIDRLSAALDLVPTVLVLDNLEQVAGAAEVVAALLRATRDLKVLATSRVALRIRAEHVLPVEPLPTPASRQTADPRTLAANPAVAHFVERAWAADPGFALTPENASDITSIVEQLDGLPLAIELAARRVGALSPAQLRLRLENDSRLLSGGPADLPLRHRSLAASIAWSHALLRPVDQVLLRRLAVFPESFTLDQVEELSRVLEAATSVDGRSMELDEVLDGLDRLTAANLVIRTSQGGERRFRLPRTVRAFALDQLRVAGEAEGAEAAARQVAPGLVDQLSQGPSAALSAEAHASEPVTEPSRNRGATKGVSVLPSWPAKRRGRATVLPASLSQRELEVLRGVADGLTNAQVADRLYLSPRTVHAHLYRIYNKLGISSRSAATRYVVQRGLA